MCVYIYTHIQGVTFRLKPYDGIKFLDVTLKLKLVSVLLPLELASNFSKGRVLEIRRFSAKKRSFWAFSGEACRNLPLNITILAQGTPRNPGQSVTFEYRVSVEIGEEYPKENNRNQTMIMPQMSNQHGEENQ